MSLFGTLTSASRSLDAQRFGLDVVGQNIANVNTAGYTRRTLDLAAIPPTSRLEAGGGVEVQGVRAIRDGLLERRLWQELPSRSMQSAVANSLSVVEVALGDAGASLDQKLTAFFDSFAHLSEDPTSATARQEVLFQGQNLASGFSDMVSRLELAQRDADTRIRGAVDEVNALVAQIAKLNASIGGAQSDGSVQTLKDQQNEALKSLAGLLDVSVMQRQDGGVDVTFGLGRPLVIGATNFSLTATPTGPSGLVVLTDANGVDVGAEIQSGSLGGYLQVRDTTIPGYVSRLDDIAFTLASQVNAIHTAGFDLDGVAGLPFFTPPGAVAGAAATLAVNPTVAADPNLVVAASVAAAGDNQAARQLADLRDSRVMFGGTATLHDAWGRLVYQAGSDTKFARLEERSRGEILLQLEALRDSVSGVSLDEEAANMIKFQRAYEANARFFTTVDSAIETLINMVAR